MDPNGHLEQCLLHARPSNMEDRVQKYSEHVPDTALARMHHDQAMRRIVAHGFCAIAMELALIWGRMR